MITFLSNNLSRILDREQKDRVIQIYETLKTPELSKRIISDHILPINDLASLANLFARYMDIKHGCKVHVIDTDLVDSDDARHVMAKFSCTDGYFSPRKGEFKFYSKLSNSDVYLVSVEIDRLTEQASRYSPQSTDSLTTRVQPSSSIQRPVSVDTVSAHPDNAAALSYHQRVSSSFAGHDDMMTDESVNLMRLIQEPTNRDPYPTFSSIIDHEDQRYGSSSSDFASSGSGVAHGDAFSYPITPLPVSTPVRGSTPLPFSSDPEGTHGAVFPYPSAPLHGENGEHNFSIDYHVRTDANLCPCCAAMNIFKERGGLNDEMILSRFIITPDENTRNILSSDIKETVRAFLDKSTNETDSYCKIIALLCRCIGLRMNDV